MVRKLLSLQGQKQHTPSRNQRSEWDSAVFWCVYSNWGPRSEEAITRVVTRLTAR